MLETFFQKEIKFLHSLIDIQFVNLPNNWRINNFFLFNVILARIIYYFSDYAKYDDQNKSKRLTSHWLICIRVFNM